MGRRRRFIDKKHGTTYYLVHKELNDGKDDGKLEGDRELATAEEIAKRRAEGSERAAAKHPLSYLFVDEDDLVKNNEQREEILSLGLPDDGYNYLKHIRAPCATVSLTPAVPKAPDTTASAAGAQLEADPGELTSLVSVSFFSER
jgi:hypothetical protein